MGDLCIGLIWAGAIYNGWVMLFGIYTICITILQIPPVFAMPVAIIPDPRHCKLRIQHLKTSKWNNKNKSRSVAWTLLCGNKCRHNNKQFQQRPNNCIVVCLTFLSPIHKFPQIRSSKIQHARPKIILIRSGEMLQPVPSPLRNSPAPEPEKQLS